MAENMIENFGKYRSLKILIPIIFLRVNMKFNWNLWQYLGLAKTCGNFILHNILIKVLQLFGIPRNSYKFPDVLAIPK